MKWELMHLTHWKRKYICVALKVKSCPPWSYGESGHRLHWSQDFTLYSVNEMGSSIYTYFALQTHSYLYNCVHYRSALGPALYRQSSRWCLSKRPYDLNMHLRPRVRGRGRAHKQSHPCNVSFVFIDWWVGVAVSPGFT